MGTRSLPRGKDTELVAFGISHDHPGLSTGLTDVDTGCSQARQAFDFGRLVIRAQVEMDFVLAELGIRTGNQEKPGDGHVLPDGFGRHQVDAGVGGLHDRPPQRLGPEAGQALTVSGVNCHAANTKGHRARVWRNSLIVTSY